MSAIVFKKVNEVYSRIVCEPGILKEISESWTRFVPKYKFHPLYKKGHWDGTKKFVHPTTGMVYTGLLKDVYKDCRNRGYTDISFYGYTDKDVFTEKEILETLETYDMPFEWRDYQIEAITLALTQKRRVILSATSSGKSAIIYAISRMLADAGKKVLVIVPSIMLANQMFSDISEYCVEDEDFNAEDYMHIVFGGKDKNDPKPIIVSTWQSIEALNTNKKGVSKEFVEYLAQFDAVIGDECHGASAKCLSAILENCVNASFRIGFTGTLDDESNTLKEGIVGLLGPEIRINTTKELMDAGVVAELEIKALLLNYPDELRKYVSSFRAKYKQMKHNKTKAYQEELDTVIGHSGRNELIANLCTKLEGNTMILVRYIELHGKPLEKLLREKTGKEVYLIYAETDDDLREDIRKKLNTISNAIVIGSYGLLSTGISIVNLHYLIAASPTKSKIKILQSIGRILRRSQVKTKATFFDLVDNFIYKEKYNYLMEHFKIRYGYYMAEEFDVEIKEINLE